MGERRGEEVAENSSPALLRRFPKIFNASLPLGKLGRAVIPLYHFNTRFYCPTNSCRTEDRL